MGILAYTLVALAVLSAAAIIAVKVILKKSWRETVLWLVEFFS